MTLISRTGFMPTRRALIQPSAPVSVKDITLVIPVLNNARGIHRLLDALRSTHSDRDMPAEVIIVDNGSTGCYESFDPSIPLRLLHCADRGPVNARNYGAMACSASAMRAK